MYPKLVIRRENNTELNSQSNEFLSFEILFSEVESMKLPCNSHDLVDFCCKVASSAFITNIYGHSTASILKYNWVANCLVVWIKGEKYVINLSMDNIDDIKRIAHPKKGGECMIY